MMAAVVFGLLLTASSASATSAAPLPASHEPTFGDTRIIRAIDAARRGEEREALTLLETYIDGPSRSQMWYDARFLAAQAALSLGEPSRALFYLEGLDESLADIGDLIWSARAQAHRTNGDWRRARAAWRRVLEGSASSERARALYGIADGYFAANDLEGARLAYEEAIAAERRSEAAMTARFNLGRIAEMQGRWADAAEYYRYLAHRYPAHSLNRPAQARLTFLAATGLGPTPTVAQRLYRIDRLLSAHSVEDAATELADLRPAVGNESDELAFMDRLARLAYRQRDYNTAIGFFAQLAAETKPRRRLEYERWLARAHSAAGDYQAAIRVHLDIASRPESASAAKEALFKGAWLAYNGGDYHQAMALFGRFVETYTDDSAAGDAYWFLGWTAYHLGDLPTAAASLRELRARSRSTVLIQRALYWEGRIAVEMGQPGVARSLFGEALADQPLTYYGALASQRLRQLDELAEVRSRGRLFASLDELRTHEVEVEVEDESLEPTAAELPTGGGMSPLRQPHLPWGASVFDWSSPQGRRAVCLMRLGFVAEAAYTVERMAPLPGHADTDVYYSRARILWGLGDYSLAFRIVGRAFRTTLTGRIDGDSRRYFQISYPTAFHEQVNATADAYGISPLLVLAVVRQESAFNTRARSWASAHGLMQIIPRTGAKIAERIGEADYDSSSLLDPATNLRFGTWYLSELVKKFRGNTALAIGSYNAGPVAMSGWVDLRAGVATDEFVEDIPFRETRNYVKRVIGNLAVYERLYGNGGLDLPDRVPEGYLDNIDF